jgi:two-component system LytT family response regulator
LIEAADYYAALHVGGKAHLLRRSMAELEEELEPSVFCRIHRSTIVNLDRVRALESGEEDETIVVLDGGARLRMSRRYRKVLQERLGVRER